MTLYPKMPLWTESNLAMTNYRNLPQGAKHNLGKDPIKDIQLSPDGGQIAVARTNSVLIYDAKTWAEISVITRHTAPITAISFRTP